MFTVFSKLMNRPKLPTSPDTDDAAATAASAAAAAAAAPTTVPDPTSQCCQCSGIVNSNKKHHVICKGCDSVICRVCCEADPKVQSTQYCTVHQVVWDRCRRKCQSPCTNQSDCQCETCGTHTIDSMYLCERCQVGYPQREFAYFESVVRPWIEELVQQSFETALIKRVLTHAPVLRYDLVMPRTIVVDPDSGVVKLETVGLFTPSAPPAPAAAAATATTTTMASDEMDVPSPPALNRTLSSLKTPAVYSGHPHTKWDKPLPTREAVEPPAHKEEAEEGQVDVEVDEDDTIDAFKRIKA